MLWNAKLICCLSCLSLLLVSEASHEVISTHWCYWEATNFVTALGASSCPERVRACSSIPVKKELKCLTKRSSTLKLQQGPVRIQPRLQSTVITCFVLKYWHRLWLRSALAQGVSLWTPVSLSTPGAPSSLKIQAERTKLSCTPILLSPSCSHLRGSNSSVSHNVLESLILPPYLQCYCVFSLNTCKLLLDSLAELLEPVLQPLEKQLIISDTSVKASLSCM